MKRPETKEYQEMSIQNKPSNNILDDIDEEHGKPCDISSS